MPTPYGKDFDACVRNVSGWAKNPEGFCAWADKGLVADLPEGVEGLSRHDCGELIAVNAAGEYAPHDCVARLDAEDGDEATSGRSRPLPLVEGGPPPTEYLMFGPGVNETVKGPLLFDDEAAEAVMAFYEARGRKRLAGDWEHDSMVPPTERRGDYRGSPASHWFSLEVRPGPELWASDVKWTPDAFEQLSKGEYAHTSPVVKFQKSTGRIMAVLSSALTNDPATIGQPQLVAASAESTKTENKMPMWKMDAKDGDKIKAVVDGEHKDMGEGMEKMKAALAESFPDHFKGSDTDPAAKAKLAEDDATKKMPAGEPLSAAEEEEKKEMKALSAAVAELTGKKTRVEQVAALTAFRDASIEVATLTAAATRNVKSAFDSVVEQGKKAMKITPADVAAGTKTKLGLYIASQRGKGEEGVAALSAYLDASAARVVTAETATREAETLDLNTVQLNAIEIASCDKNGTSKVEMLKLKRERVAEQLSNGITPRL
jgi:phage I-like protein